MPRNVSHPVHSFHVFAGNDLKSSEASFMFAPQGVKAEYIELIIDYCFIDIDWLILAFSC